MSKEKQDLVYAFLYCDNIRKLPTHAKAMGWALNLRTNALDSTTYSAFQDCLHN
jgi:hypothetical protein